MKSEEEKEKRVAEMLYGLAEVFDKENLSPLAIEIYFQIVKEFTFEQIQEAGNRAVRELKWFPKPVELLELIQGSKAELELRGNVQAYLVLGAISSIGSNESVKFQDPVTTAVIKRVYSGWIELGDLRTEETKWFLREFAQHYANFAKSRITDHEHCAGRIERDNIASGYLDDIPTPLLVGDDGKPKLLN